MWHGIFHCNPRIKDNCMKRTLMRCSHLMFLLSFGWLIPISRADCPGQNLQDRALRCFNNFNTQKVHLDRSGSRLFSGIDIEVLRIFCSSYVEAMDCIADLIGRCPEDRHREIKVALLNFSGMERELQSLCTTKDLYETYAQHMTCYLERGPKSDWCFDRSLNVSLNELTQEELCSRMREVTICIENNIRHGCGEEASELVHLLVKATVRRSASCTYTVYPHQDDLNSTKEDVKPANSANKHVHSPKNSTKNLSFNILYLILCLQLTIFPYIFR